MFEVVRVQSIVLDKGHEKYKGEESIGTICYTNFQEPTSNIGCKDNLTAKPYWNNIGYYPIPNELVYLVQFPSPDYNNSIEDSNFINYYLPPGSIHKKPTSNILPNFLDENNEPYLGKYFKDLGNFIRPLRPYEGDIIFEGRFGQSIRFGSTINNQIENTPHPNNWSNVSSESIGNPITIIKNGQSEIPVNNKLHIIENINKDNSSIYLCSNQKIDNFIPSSLHDESYGQDIFKEISKEETLLSNETMLSDTIEDITLNTPDNLPPEELQQLDELSDLTDIDTAYYDISPTEKQIISPNDIIILSNNYIIPDTVTTNYLNQNTETKFNKIHTIKSILSEELNIDNYPGVDKFENPTLTEEYIWNNLQILHKKCIDPIVDAFGIDNIRITSAYRSIELNKSLGGNPDSQHTKGYAVDLISISHESSVLFNWCKNNLPEWNQLIWEFPERGDFIIKDQPFSWIHLSYIEGNNPKTRTMSSEVDVYHESINEAYPDEMIRRGKYLHGIPEADNTII